MLHLDLDRDAWDQGSYPCKDFRKARKEKEGPDAQKKVRRGPAKRGKGQDGQVAGRDEDAGDQRADGPPVSGKKKEVG